MTDALVYNAKYARFADNPARQMAYRLFAQDPSRPITDWLPELERLAGQKIAVRTVQQWRHTDAWDRRYAEESAAYSGSSSVQAVVRLRVAAPIAVAYLDAVARGEESYDHGRVQTARFIVGEHTKLMLAHPVAVEPPDAGELLGDISVLSDQELYALAQPKE